MKKILFLMGVFISQLSLNAQTVNVHFKNGQVIKYPYNNVEYVDFSEKTDDPIISEGEAVDLGLSVLWATCNLGAKSPEEDGYLFAWGEVSPKDYYFQDTYSYYDNDKEIYIDIGSDISGTEYDAAHVMLGKGWRIPTKDEMNELVEKCNWEWTQLNNQNGFKVTGPNGASIFLSAADKINGGICYQTSTESSVSDCWTVVGRSSMEPTIYIWESKWIGHTIRPVLNK